MSTRPNTSTPDTEPSQHVAMTALGYLTIRLGPKPARAAWEAMEEYCRLVLRNDPNGQGTMPALIFDGKGGVVAGVKGGGL